MPIYNEDEDSAILPSPTAVLGTPVVTVPIVDDKYRGIAQDTQVTPAHTLMPMIDGSSWTVEYYSQILNSDSPLIQQSVSTSGTLLQYKRIEKLDLRVIDALSTQQDAETKTMRAEGRAIVYAGFIPNENDAFVADVGVGSPAVFKVVSSEKKSFLAGAAYEISYAIMGQDSHMLDDLAAKTVQSFVFNKDNLATGKGALVELSQHQILDQVVQVSETLMYNYINEFYNRHVHTFLAPLQEKLVYDPFLVKFLMESVQVTAHPDLQRLTAISMAEDLVYLQGNLWKALLENNPELITQGFSRAGVTEVTRFSGNPTVRGVRWTGLNYVVYPLDPKIGFGGLRQASVKAGADYDYLVDSTASKFYPRQNHAIADNDSEQTTTPLNLTPSLIDDYYVLSQKFYSKDPTMDLLEREVWNCLEGRALDGEQLIRSAKLIPSWNALDRYYKAPLVLHLLRTFIRGHYSWS